MNFLEKLRIVLQSLYDEKSRFVVKNYLGLTSTMEDEEYLKLQFEIYVGRKLDLVNPKTFNEKLQWLKLYDRKDLYTTMVDKHLVKEYVSKKIGAEYVIPTIGVWKNPDDIDFKSLPDKFVLKCNHNSGTGMFICKDKQKINKALVIQELKKGLKQDYFLFGREWPYKNVDRVVIAEEFLESKEGEDLEDYKLQCFNGKVDNILVCCGRFSKQGVRYHYFSPNWDYLPYSPYEDIDASTFTLPKPKNISLMISIAEKLSKGIPELRVDLYNIDGKIYFGELTFFSQSGWDTDITYEADMIMGDKLILPQK